jgi:hypothetical protein
MHAPLYYYNKIAAMKRTLIILSICAGMALTACKGRGNTTAGDSTGTGAIGARVPGYTTKDTTRNDSATATGMDSTHKSNDTTKVQ